MSATLAASCPKCKKVLNVPVTLIGKMIKCKECQTAFEVKAATGSKPAAAKPATAKPATAARPAKPTVAKPAAPASEPKAEEGATFKFKDDPPPPPPPPSHKPYADADDEDDDNPYGVTKEAGEDIPRCPSCATELDPPDAQICLNCGFDMINRRRHETRAVYETTKMDIFIHLLPGIACVIGMIAIITLDFICFFNMRDWLTGTFLESDEKDEATLKKKFILSPYCFNLWIGVFSMAILYALGKFAVKRLILNPKPIEVKKAMEGE